jgi:hypothetical protein
LEFDVPYSNAVMWQASVHLDGSDLMLGLHPVSLIGAFG